MLQVRVSFHFFYLSGNSTPGSKSYSDVNTLADSAHLYPSAHQASFKGCPCVIVGG